MAVTMFRITMREQDNYGKFIIGIADDGTIRGLADKDIELAMESMSAPSTMPAHHLLFRVFLHRF
jgi:hypothetical protein